MIFTKACCSFLWTYLVIGACFAFRCYADANQTSTLVVDVSDSGRQIPDTLFGIFFEVAHLPFQIFKILIL